MAEKIPVAVLGSTGSVGQRFVQLLVDHPWFQLTAITGSDRTAGRPYGEACRWVLAEPMPDSVRNLIIQPSDPARLDCPLVFSALPSALAKVMEPEFAAAGALICSNASAFRADEDVPLLLPEVNPEHAHLLATQRQKRGWKGGITTNPNCTSAGLTVALKALQQAFGLRRAFVVSLQALSGAGYPGVASLDVIDNVIPFIGGEEEKVEWEPRKMLGQLQDGKVVPDKVAISAHTNRVAVSDGHLVCASLEFDRPVAPQEAIKALSSFQIPPEARDLPSAPVVPIVVRSEPDRPQPRLDRWSGGGMTTVVGRVRSDQLFHIKLVVLSHNTVRGAAGGSIFNAELLHSQGYLA